MRTSLGIASLGLLDRGANPSLHIASIGMLREDGDAPITGGVIGDEIVPRGMTRREKQIREEDEIAAMIAMAFVEMNER